MHATVDYGFLPVYNGLKLWFPILFADNRNVILYLLSFIPALFAHSFMPIAYSRTSYNEGPSVTATDLFITVTIIFTALNGWVIHCRFYVYIVGTDSLISCTTHINTY